MLGTVLFEAVVTCGQVVPRGVNGYPLPLLLLGSKIGNGYPWKRGCNVYIPEVQPSMRRCNTRETQRRAVKPRER